MQATEDLTNAIQLLANTSTLSSSICFFRKKRGRGGAPMFQRALTCHLSNDIFMGFYFPFCVKGEWVLSELKRPWKSHRCTLDQKILSWTTYAFWLTALTLFTRTAAGPTLSARAFPVPRRRPGRANTPWQRMTWCQALSTGSKPPFDLLLHERGVCARVGLTDGSKRR